MDKFPPYRYNDNMMSERKATMDIKDWVSEIAGYKVSDEEVAEFLKEYNEWIDEQEAIHEISPDVYGGN